ncbi:hypothetical protein [Glutamicibacter sp.]|uniref:hypothetical protein n=1 Tax=Glutamicibacter sp. TaxID=1931995 RepID=UPI003D6B0652
MNQPPLNPDAQTRRDIMAGQIGAWMDEWDDGKADTGHVATHIANRLAENGVTTLTVAQLVVNSVEELITTRAGLALANAAFNEGLSAGIRACNESLEGEPFVKPVSPYSAPLLAMIKADRPEVNDA